MIPDGDIISHNSMLSELSEELRSQVSHCCLLIN